MKKKVILLTGFMCAGKTTVAKILAERLKLVWYDLDSLIEQKAGQTVSEIFESEGEAGFRHRENLVLSEVIGQNQVAIVAAGGGVPLFANNQVLMKKGAITVFLDTDWSEIKKRISSCVQIRPMLNGLSARAVEELWCERRKIYFATSDYVVHNLSELEMIVREKIQNCG